jgi:hypothetical protein
MISPRLKAPWRHDGAELLSDEPDSEPGGGPDDEPGGKLDDECGGGCGEYDWLMPPGQPLELLGTPDDGGALDDDRAAELELNDPADSEALAGAEELDDSEALGALLELLPLLELYVQRHAQHA